MHKASTTNSTRMPILPHKTHHRPYLWNCKETEPERIRMNIPSEVGKGEKEEMEKLITYVKKI
jgi:hypothetical protein